MVGVRAAIAGSSLLLADPARGHLRGEESTTWEVVRLPDLQRPAVNMSSFQFQLRKNGEPFIVKGMCYSPAEINSNINDVELDAATFHVSTMFGDYFWDEPAKELPWLSTPFMALVAAGCLCRFALPKLKPPARASEPLLADVDQVGGDLGLDAKASDKLSWLSGWRMLWVALTVLVCLAGGLQVELGGPASNRWLYDNPLLPTKNWYALWGDGHVSLGQTARGDLATMAKELNANAVRVYFMQSRVFEMDREKVVSPESCAKRSHKAFLDEAHRNGLYVLVGLGMPVDLFHKMENGIAPQDKLEWWEFVLNETAAEVGSHPATLGFTIMNELDDAPNAFPGMGLSPKPDASSDFFYSQTVKYSRWVRAQAPGKLVGWALHDVPQWLGFASRSKPTMDTEHLSSNMTYFAQVASVFDYFGVNAYHSDYWHELMGSWGDAGEIGQGGKSYGAPSLAEHAKPVLLTELGWPATGRANHSGVLHASDPLVDNAVTQTRVADLIEKMLKPVYEEYQGMTLGAFYFEYADEWWKTPKELAGDSSKASAFHHDGGNMCNNYAFPNWCNDEESFGLYSRQRAPGREANMSNFHGRPVLPVDDLVPRGPMIEAIRGIFAGAQPHVSS